MRKVHVLPRYGEIAEAAGTSPDGHVDVEVKDLHDLRDCLVAMAAYTRAAMRSYAEGSYSGPGFYRLRAVPAGAFSTVGYGPDDLKVVAEAFPETRKRYMDSLPF